MTPADGSVIVAPNVLLRLVTMAIRAVPGVARLGKAPQSQPGTFGGDDTGVIMRVGAERAGVDCYLIVQPDLSLLEVGLAVQASVSAVLRELAGMTAREVNVYIQDIGDATPYPTGEVIGHG